MHLSAAIGAPSGAPDVVFKAVEKSVEPDPMLVSSLLTRWMPVHFSSGIFDGRQPAAIASVSVIHCPRLVVP
jgi:hypothetical protein